MIKENDTDQNGPLTGRQQEILDRARTDGLVQVDALAAALAVTPQTIRRDLKTLCEKRILQRIHGGAQLHAGVENLGYKARQAMNSEAKRAIGQLAATLIPNDSSLFINIGTTTEAVANALLHHTGLLVATNNLNIVETLRGNQSLTLHIAGGGVRNEDGGIVGNHTAEFMSQFKMTHALIGVSGLDADGTLLDYDQQEVLVAQSIIKNARSVVLVADATKFERSAPMRIGDISQIDVLVTDRTPPDSFVSLCRDRGVQIMTTEADRPTDRPTHPNGQDD